MKPVFDREFLAGYQIREEYGPVTTEFLRSELSDMLQLADADHPILRELEGQ